MSKEEIMLLFFHYVCDQRCWSGLQLFRIAWKHSSAEEPKVVNDFIRFKETNELPDYVVTYLEFLKAEDEKRRCSHTYTVIK